MAGEFYLSLALFESLSREKNPSQDQLVLERRDFAEMYEEKSEICIF